VILLDLFCGAGGMAEGYRRIGFDVVGVDRVPQPRYPGRFIQADALIDFHWIAAEVQPVAIHASPPCQASSKLKARWRDRDHPELIPSTRRLLAATGLPYVIENVEGAKLVNPIMLCGSAFGIGVRRHRLFEVSFAMMAPGCAHGRQPNPVPVYGHTGSGANRGREADLGRANDVAAWSEAMGIDWMTAAELAQAVPPAYAEFIGERLLGVVG
jgi:DNA (cytosine-5)-methyltransferase 1